jgi:serine/threonine protein kinase
LIRLIGQGMTSKVFMIRLTKDHNQIFALKVIVNQYWERRHEYILNEVKVLESFKSNPHIINVVEYGRASFLDTEGKEWGQFFMVFEYPRGGHLIGMLMDMDHLGENAGRYFLRQIAIAVGEMHNKGVAHRDLKPENIMLD